MIRGRAMLMMRLTCGRNDSLWSKITPRNLPSFLYGSGWLLQMRGGGFWFVLLEGFGGK